MEAMQSSASCPFYWTPLACQLFALPLNECGLLAWATRPRLGDGGMTEVADPVPGRDKHEPTQLLLCFGTRSFLCPRIHTPRAVPHALSSISCRVDAPSPSPPLRITSSIYRGPLRARTVSRRCPLCPRRNGPHPRVFDDGGLCRRACLALICELTLISMQGSFCTGRLSIQLKKKRPAWRRFPTLSLPVFTCQRRARLALSSARRVPTTLSKRACAKRPHAACAAHR